MHDKDFQRPPVTADYRRAATAEASPPPAGEPQAQAATAVDRADVQFLVDLAAQDRVLPFERRNLVRIARQLVAPPAPQAPACVQSSGDPERFVVADVAHRGLTLVTLRTDEDPLPFTAGQIVQVSIAGLPSSDAETAPAAVEPHTALTGEKEREAEAIQAAIDALEMAQTGLQWYRGLMPEYVDGSDAEADEQIAAAITRLRAASPSQGEDRRDGE